MSLSINTNLTAQSAIRSLRISDNQLTTASTQLASGNEIVNPSINASGLAIGTSLQTAASTLQTALNGANNATSLLQLASGGLTNVGNILQRMQSLATQANGATSTTQGFLNQEYQALISQINQIATGTSYNTTSLLNGNLAGSVALTTNQTPAGAIAGGFQPIYVASNVAGFADQQTVIVGGQTITLTNNASNVGEAYVGNVPTITSISVGIANYLNASTNPVLDQFVYGGVGGFVFVKYRGGLVTTANNAIQISTANGTFPSADDTVETATIAAGGANGLNPLRVFATGTINDANFANTGTVQGAVNADYIFGSPIENNAGFIGNIVNNNPIAAVYNNALNSVTLSLNVGGFSYTADNTTTTTAGTVITFNGINSSGTSGGSFTIVQTGSIGVNNQTTANSYAQEITNALSGITFMQNQTVSSYIPGGLVISGGAVTGSLLNTAFNFTSNTFASPTVSSVTVSAPPAGQTNATISMVVNGQTFTTTATPTPLGNTIAAGTEVVLTNASNPIQSMTFMNGAIALQLTTAAQAAVCSDCLTNCFRAKQYRQHDCTGREPIHSDHRRDSGQCVGFRSRSCRYRSIKYAGCRCRCECRVERYQHQQCATSFGGCPRVPVQLCYLEPDLQHPKYPGCCRQLS